MRLLSFLKERVERIKRELHLVYKAMCDSRVPLPTKAIVVAALLYAISPFDFIPDYIPVLGMLDDLIFVPLAIRLALRLIPKPIVEEYRESMMGIARASKWEIWITGLVVILVWTMLLYFSYQLIVLALHWLLSGTSESITVIRGVFYVG